MESHSAYHVQKKKARHFSLTLKNTSSKQAKYLGLKFLEEKEEDNQRYRRKQGFPEEDCNGTGKNNKNWQTASHKYRSFYTAQKASAK